MPSHHHGTDCKQKTVRGVACLHQLQDAYCALSELTSIQGGSAPSIVSCCHVSTVIPAESCKQCIANAYKQAQTDELVPEVARHSKTLTARSLANRGQTEQDHGTHHLGNAHDFRIKKSMDKRNASHLCNSQIDTALYVWSRLSSGTLPGTVRTLTLRLHKRP
jgi:hypothetical protein